MKQPAKSSSARHFSTRLSAAPNAECAQRRRQPRIAQAGALKVKEQPTAWVCDEHQLEAAPLLSPSSGLALSRLRRLPAAVRATSRHKGPSGAIGAGGRDGFGPQVPLSVPDSSTQEASFGPQPVKAACLLWALRQARCEQVEMRNGLVCLRGRICQWAPVAPSPTTSPRLTITCLPSRAHPSSTSACNVATPASSRCR